MGTSKSVLAITALLFSVVGVLVAKTEAQPAREPEGGVSYSYTSLVTHYYGALGPPEQREVFGEDIRKEHVVTARAAGKTITCPLAWQDVAYFLDHEGKRKGRVVVFGYQGCPFAIDADLEPRKNFEMREETRIEIESATGNILWVSPTSARPFANQGDELVKGVQMLVNVVWVFKKKGTAFRANSVAYTVDKDAATIRFTRTGVVLDGVQKSESR